VHNERIASMSATHQAVLLADIIGSRKMKGFRQIRDAKIDFVSKQHLLYQFVRYQYAVTAGDEFQNVLSAVEHIPRVVFDLRCEFYPIGLWIGIGIGEVEALPKKDEAVNVAGIGEAFELAREAMNELKGGAAQKYRFLTALRSTEPLFDLSVNLTYRLHDTLLLRISDSQWKTILVQRQTHSQSETAAQLGVAGSTVSRTLQRGFYWQLEDTMSTLTKQIRALHAQ
jgi:hypothetical protein